MKALLEQWINNWAHCIAKIFVRKPSQKPPFSLSDLLDGISDDNLHGEVEVGCATGSEVW